MAKSETVKTKQIAVRLPYDLLDQIQQLAKEEQRSRANMIRLLLREAINKRTGP